MQNRNFFKSSQKRPSSNLRLDTDSFQISNSKNYDFLGQNFNDFNQSNLPSPIMKMNFELSPNMSRQDLNYSSNTYIQDQPSRITHKSYAQSPEKENKFDTKLNYLAAKKYSIPDARMVTEVLQKQKHQHLLKHYGSNEMVKPLKKLNGQRNGFRPQNEEEFLQNNQSKQVQFYSQKLIQNKKSQEDSDKYRNLAINFQELQRELESMKHQNMRLKKSKEDLMNENIQIKRESLGQINAFSNEIEQLKEHIYRIQMERQQFSTARTVTNTNRLGFSRTGTVLSGRGSFSQPVDPGNVNNFYVQELEKQNEQLVRENRRLNEIVMKRLKHSIAE